ncbi:YwiC-like family protein [Streptomyces sp. NPDC058657]|uniref:YwiC-like family protein n=1 Tax=unclassified Streptomyces TaxID=2593676 RepID=UPI00364E721C
MHSWAHARTVAASAAPALLPRRLPPAEAVGRSLARPLVSLTDLPAFATSAMDGWAVCGPGPWQVRGRVLAGDSGDVGDTGARLGPGGTGGPGSTGDTGGPGSTGDTGGTSGSRGSAGPLVPGSAVAIATGAPVPEGTALVLRSEDGELGADGLLTARGALAPPGRDIRPRGQECRAGDALLPAGTRVTPAVLGLAAACGHDALTVTARPTADLLVLGDELLDRGLPGRGRVRDALGPLLVPWLDALGALVSAPRRIADDLGALRTALATSTADVVLTTGGSARGPVDHVRRALESLGARLLVDSVALRPGHPMLLAVLPDGRPVVGLPGNPFAAVAATATLAVPLLRTLAGLPQAASVGLPAGVRLTGRAPSTALVPVAVRARAVHPLDFRGPAMLRGLALCDALAVVPPGGVRGGCGRTAAARTGGRGGPGGGPGGWGRAGWRPAGCRAPGEWGPAGWCPAGCRAPGGWGRAGWSPAGCRGECPPAGCRHVRAGAGAGAAGGRRVSRRTTWVPVQHGAWAMLTVPFAAGTFLGGATWLHLPLFVCWLLAYTTAFHLQQFVRLRRLSRNPRAARRHLRPLLVLGAVLAVLGCPLLVLRPWLLVAVVAALPFCVVNTWYALRNRERALVNGLVAVVPACAVLLVALRLGGGTLAEGAVPLALCLLYFGGTVLYVKTMIRERHNPRYLYASVAYHAVALVCAVLLLPVSAVLFGCCLLRAVLLPGRGLRVRTVGLVELGCSAALLGILLAR